MQALGNRPVLLPEQIALLAGVLGEMVEFGLPSVPLVNKRPLLVGDRRLARCGRCWSMMSRIASLAPLARLFATIGAVLVVEWTKPTVFNTPRAYNNLLPSFYNRGATLLLDCN